MNARTCLQQVKLAVGTILILLAVIAAPLGAVLVWNGCNPPAGEGSLGHVGMVIAGVILLFAALLMGLVGGFLRQVKKGAEDQGNA